MKQQKKRIFGILLSFALMLTMMPALSQTAFAGVAPPYAQYKNTTTVIKFDSKDWYLIDYDASTVTLLAKECIGTSEFDENSTSYSGSTIETFVNNWYRDNVTADAKSAVSGGMFLLEAGTANGLIENVLKCSWVNDYGNFWWLSTPVAAGENDRYVAFVKDGVVKADGSGMSVYTELGVRPALKLDLSKVAFDSESKTFSIPTLYPLWVGGTQVTSVNADNILGDNTASYDDSTKTLTLKDANITTGYLPDGNSDLAIGIYYVGSEGKLVIESPEGSDNKIISASKPFNRGIASANVGITFSGKGKLTTVAGAGIEVYTSDGDVIIDGSNVTVSNSNRGIQADNVTVFDGSVTAKCIGRGIGSNNITIDGGNVEAEGLLFGIEADDIIINDGTVNASGYYGIYTTNTTVNGGTVNATGMNNELHPSGMSTMRLDNPAGICAGGAVEIKGGKVIAAGDGHGILAYGLVKNHIDGTGWTDKAGTAGKTAIAINKEGQDLEAYKKVQFPAKVDPKPTPTPTPTPKTNAPKVTTTAKTSAMAMTVKWTMKWGKVNGAKSYKVAYRKVGSKKWTYKNTKKTSYVVKGHKMKGLYEYKVAAVSKKGTVWSGTSRRYFNGVKANAKAAKGAIKASWKKDKSATGYQVLVATNKKMNSSKVYNVSSSAKSYKVKGLKKGKTYYVRVRPMKKAGGVTYKGILSKIHKVKVK